MLIPTWITLKKLPLHYFGVAQEIAASLGTVLGKDAQNNHFKDPRFCIALDTSTRWETEIEIEDRITGNLLTILVDYANLPIRCRYCNALTHQIRDCPQKKTGTRQALHRSHLNRPGIHRNRQTIDEDGFTLIPHGNRQSTAGGTSEPQDAGNQIEAEAPGAFIPANTDMSSHPPSTPPAPPVSPSILPQFLPGNPPHVAPQPPSDHANSDPIISQSLPQPNLSVHHPNPDPVGRDDSFRATFQPTISPVPDDEDAQAHRSTNPNDSTPSLSLLFPT